MEKVVASAASVRNQIGRHIPLLVRRGGRDIKKMPASLLCAKRKRVSAQPQVMERTGWSLTLQCIRCERPPRLRRFGGFATFYYWRSHPSSRGGDYAVPRIFAKNKNQTYTKKNLLPLLCLIYHCFGFSKLNIQLTPN
jgi:hypothetical protein